jgi:selenocysteine-specific elongation factor
MDTRFFPSIVTKMVSEGKLVEDAAFLYLPDFKIRYTSEQSNGIKKLQSLFEKSPFTPPSIAECIALVGEEVFNVLVDNEIFLRISQDVVFDPKNLEKLRLIILKYFDTHPTLSVAEFRDLVGTSRKFALAVLEYLDDKGVTVRKGESRVLIVKPPLTD